MQPVSYDSDQIFQCVRPQINVHRPGRSYTSHHMRQHLLDFLLNLDDETLYSVKQILKTRGMTYAYYKDRMTCKATCGYETTLFVLSKMFTVNICVIRSDFVWVSSDVHPTQCQVILIQLNDGKFCGTKPSRPFDVGMVPNIHVPKLGVRKFVQTSTPGRWQESSELKSALQRTDMSPICPSPATSVEPPSTVSGSTQSAEGSSSMLSDILSGNSLSTEYKSMANIVMTGDDINFSQDVTEESSKVPSENSDSDRTLTEKDREVESNEDRNVHHENIEGHTCMAINQNKEDIVPVEKTENVISSDATFLIDDMNNKFVSHDHSYSKSRSHDDDKVNPESENTQHIVGDDDTTITGSQDSNDENSEEDRKDAELGEKYLFDQLSDRLETTLTVENSSDEAERINPVRNVNKFSLVSDGNVTKVIVWPHNTVVATRLEESKEKEGGKGNTLDDIATEARNTMHKDEHLDNNDEITSNAEKEKDIAELCDLPTDHKLTPENELKTDIQVNDDIIENTNKSKDGDVEKTVQSERKEDNTSAINLDGQDKTTNYEVSALKNITKDVSIPLQDISFEVPITSQNDSFIIHGEKENTSVVMFACRKCPEVLYSLTSYNQHLFRKHRITYVSRYPAKLIERMVSPKKVERPSKTEDPMTSPNSDAKCIDKNEEHLPATTEEKCKKTEETEINEEEGHEPSESGDTLHEVQEQSAGKILNAGHETVTSSSVSGEGAHSVDHATIKFSNVQSPKASPNPRKPKSFWISQHTEDETPKEHASPIAHSSSSAASRKTKTLGYVRRSSRPKKSTQTSTSKQREEIRTIFDGDDIQDVTNEDEETESYMNVKLPKDELKRYRRKYACNYCETKTFTEQGYLLHIRNEHKINYQCCNCLKPFHFEDSYQRHRKICIEGKTHLEEIFDVDEPIFPKNVSKNSDPIPTPQNIKIQLDLKATSTDEDTIQTTKSQKNDRKKNQGGTKGRKSSVGPTEDNVDDAVNEYDDVTSRGRKRKRGEVSTKKRPRDDNSKKDRKDRKPLKDSEKLGNESFKKLLQEFDLTMRPMKKSKKLKDIERKKKEIYKVQESQGMKLRPKEVNTHEESVNTGNSIKKKKSGKMSHEQVEGQNDKDRTSMKSTAKEESDLPIKKARRSTRRSSKNSDNSADIELQESQDISPVSDLTGEAINTAGRNTRSKSKNSDQKNNTPVQHREEDEQTFDDAPGKIIKTGRKTRSSSKNSDHKEDSGNTHSEEPSPISDMINQQSGKRGKKRKRNDSVKEESLAATGSKKKFTTKKPPSKRSKQPKKKPTVRDADETLSADEEVSDGQPSEQSSEEDDGQFYCQVCDKTFSDYAEFKEHKVKCTKIPKKYICPECKYTFAQKCLRDQHYRWTHTDLPPEFVCKICDKAYPYKKSLEEHNIRKHSEDFKFLCDICTRGFNHLGEFNQHRASHTGVKEFKCGKCNIKSFSSVGKLNYHLKHCGKPNQYECSVCGKKFSSPRGIAEHVTNEHNDKTERKIYQCPICPGATYTSHGGYCRHLREKHQVGRKGQTLDAAVVESFFQNMQQKPKK